jgi:uncharacterized protein (DUF58 family)
MRTVEHTTSDLLKKVRRIELKTKGLSTQIFSGEYHSAFKGKGMAFSEVREYMPGDEIRTIDWNVTARLGEPYVKVFEEERELTVILVIDISASDNFGTKERLKRTLIAELSAVLAFSASQNNDKVGVLFFTDRVEKFIPPKKGKGHILRIIRELLEYQPVGKGTNISEALGYLNRVMKRRAITFLISDFIAQDDFTKDLKMANRRHDLVALQVQDQRELELPDVGLVRFFDPETGEDRWVNTSSKKVRTHYKAENLAFQKNLEDTFKKSGVDFTTILTHENYVKPLMNLFKRRG